MTECSKDGIYVHILSTPLQSTGTANNPERGARRGSPQSDCFKGRPRGGGGGRLMAEVSSVGGRNSDVLHMWSGGGEKDAWEQIPLKEACFLK